MPKDFPINECRARADVAIGRGFTIYQKFTCAQCGNRLTMDVPNAFFTTGGCDRCGHVTDIVVCGFSAVIGIGV